MAELDLNTIFDAICSICSIGTLSYSSKHVKCDILRDLNMSCLSLLLSLNCDYVAFLTRSSKCQRNIFPMGPLDHIQEFYTILGKTDENWGIM